jgi:predicted deacylase
MIKRWWQEITGKSPFQSHRLSVIDFVGSAEGPSVYMQGSLHADEQPGAAILHHLALVLEEAESAGKIVGRVRIVPQANPIGLHQNVMEQHMGRYHLGSRTNFNRSFDLVDSWDKLPAPQEARGVDLRLKRHLMGLAKGHDVILDLHCDDEAILYLYCYRPRWPQAQALAARTGAKVALLWDADFDTEADAFEEAVTKPFVDSGHQGDWLTATMEYRGQADTDPAVMAEDARRLYLFLVDRGVVEDEAPPAPELSTQAVSLRQVMNIFPPALGTLLFHAKPGDRLEKGDLIAQVLVEPGSREGAVDVVAPEAGLLMARSKIRLARPSEKIAALICDREVEGNRLGNMLSP